MNKQKFMPELADDKDRLSSMQSMAAKVDETKRYVTLTPLELDIKREKLTENLIALDQENESFDLVKEEHKAKVKPLQAENSILITEVRTGQELREGTFYDIPDYESNLMVTYDNNGDWVAERRLRPDEKQGQSKMFIPKGFQGKTGTHE